MGRKQLQVIQGQWHPIKKIFETAVSQAGAILASDPNEAFEFAAAFATKPLPNGRKVIVVTTAGGWGVITADAISRSRLDLMDLPQDLEEQIDQFLPPRWSKNNPVVWPVVKPEIPS